MSEHAGLDEPPVAKPQSLGGYTASFDRGRSRLVEVAWLAVQAIFMFSALPGSWHRALLLRMFGARLGRRIVLRPRLRVKFPWRLRVGDDTWIGEDVWIDNLAMVEIGANCCISQGSYICTGSHDWSRPSFDLITEPVRIEDRAWLGARSTLGPGVKVGEGAVLSLGSVATADLDAWTIYRGNPAVAVRQRLAR